MFTAEARLPASQPVYLTIAEVARILKVSVATLRRWYRNGIGPRCFRVGDAVRYTRDDVDGFVLNNPLKKDGHAA